MNADKMKIEMRVMLWYLKRHLKKNYKITLDGIKEDLEYCGNPVISTLWNINQSTAEKIKEDYQKEIVMEFPMALLWIIYRDTAYMPIAMYMIKELLDRKDEIYPQIEKYYQNPDDWYCNAWHDSKEHTKKMKEEGKIPNVEGIMSNDEAIFVPGYQYEKNHPVAEKLVKQMDEEFEKKRKDKNYGIDDKDE